MVYFHFQATSRVSLHTAVSVQISGSKHFTESAEGQF